MIFFFINYTHWWKKSGTTFLERSKNQKVSKIKNKRSIFFVRYMIIKPVCIIWHPYYCIHLSKYLPVASKSATLLFKYNLLRKCFLNMLGESTHISVFVSCYWGWTWSKNVIFYIVMNRVSLRLFMKKLCFYWLEKLCLIFSFNVHDSKVGKLKHNFSMPLQIKAKKRNFVE